LVSVGFKRLSRISGMTWHEDEVASEREGVARKESFVAAGYE
jgi:hypothetical protein